MALSKEEIETLAGKLIAGTITPIEQGQLNDWLDAQMGKDTYEVDTSFATNSEVLRERMLLQILAQLEPAEKRMRKQRTRRLALWSAAAAVLLAVSTITWFSLRTPHVERDIELAVDDILPGGNRATLMLADGQTIELSPEQHGIVVGNEITYMDGSTVLGEHSITHSLTLTTPKGGTYHVTLPDGSQVWLNAGSTLKYPSHFEINERVVTLEGEAYFAIKQQRIKGGDANVPFKVLSAGQTVEVLGTEFNITAYPDELETKTTLVKGKVNVLNLMTDIVHQLKPGTQSIIHDTTTRIRQVDTEQYTAWKDGYFYFDGLSPQEAFSQLGRWYDLDVIYRSNVPTVRFFGMIERSKSFESNLNILGKSGVKFEVENVSGRNRLIVISE